MRPRIMLDVRIFASPKMIALPSDRHRVAFIDLLCEAKQQDPEGVFASMAVLRYAAKHRKDTLTTLLDEGLLHAAKAMCAKCLAKFGDLGEARVVVHDWHDFQVSRTTLWRNDRETPDETVVEQPRNNNATVHAGARGSRSLSSSETPNEEDANRRVEAASDDRDALDTYYDLTRFRPWGLWSGDKLNGAIREYGNDAVDGALRAEWAIEASRDTLMDRAFARLARDAEKVRRAKPRRTRPVVDRDAVYAAQKAAERELLEAS